jgi:CMP-N-acetylneuraminic acid synthetase
LITNRTRKVCVVLVDRANYGRLKPAMEAIQAHPQLELQVVAAGTMVLDRFELPVEVVRRDGFPIDGEIYIEVEGSNPTTMAKSVGFGLIEFAGEFRRLDPDIVLLIGDRYEALAAAVAAAYMNLCLVHIQGGEVSGSIDESARHAITKFAHFHVPSTERARDYIVQMGERSETVLTVGCPSSDIARTTDMALDPAVVNGRGSGATIDLDRPYQLVVFHPTTTEYGVEHGQMNELLAALAAVGKQTIGDPRAPRPRGRAVAAHAYQRAAQRVPEDPRGRVLRDRQLVELRARRRVRRDAGRARRQPPEGPRVRRPRDARARRGGTDPRRDRAPTRARPLRAQRAVRRRPRFGPHRRGAQPPRALPAEAPRLRLPRRGGAAHGDGVRILGLITARGGSKGVPRKNITLFAGKPLLQWTCEAALAARALDRVVLSTDDAEIAECGATCGVDVPFLRPAELARDDTPTLPVVQHALTELPGYDAVCLLQPTNPLRTGRDIDDACQLMRRTGADSVVSVARVPGHFHPMWTYFVHGGELQLAGADHVVPRRQELPPAYYREGSIYITRSDVVLEGDSLYGERVVPYFIAEDRGGGIDTWEDLRELEGRVVAP